MIPYKEQPYLLLHFALCFIVDSCKCVFYCLPVKKLEDLYIASKEAQITRSAQKNKAISGESVVTVTKRVNLPTQVKYSMYYCSYCGKQCNSEKQWDEHTASEKHNFNVNSDKEHQWNHRQPPWGLPGTNYELCFK